MFNFLTIEIPNGLIYAFNKFIFHFVFKTCWNVQFTGITVFTAEGERVGQSTTAARHGISMVTISRIIMAAPGMVLIPMFMDRLEKKGVLAKYVKAFKGRNRIIILGKNANVSLLLVRNSIILEKYVPTLQYC